MAIPIQATDQIDAAVVKPRTEPLVLIIVPAPKKPIPDTTWPINLPSFTLMAPDSAFVVVISFKANWANSTWINAAIVAPRQTKAWVLNPADTFSLSLLKPIAPPINMANKILIIMSCIFLNLSPIHNLLVKLKFNNLYIPST